MKKYFLVISLMLIGWTFTSCDKTEKPDDDIVFTSISKTIIAPNTDSIRGTCKPLIFEFINNDYGYSINMNYSNIMIECDAFGSIVTDSETDNITVFDEGMSIDANENWTPIKNLNLDNFAGKGERYIGYRVCEYPSGIYMYYYRWIKVKLSVNRDTLEIISNATNYTEDNSIIIGQLE